MLQMTDEQRYSAVLKELGEVLQEKNTTIRCQKWQIDQLKEKLEAAEKECDFAKEKLADAGVKISILLEEVEQLKGGAA
jgi:chromosome segregation ATPase